jgi:hypothetical protein
MAHDIENLSSNVAEFRDRHIRWTERTQDASEELFAISDGPVGRRRPGTA